MKIVFGNQKGGVGKSTLCVMLANYLTVVKKKDVVLLDMDIQKTIDERRGADKQVAKTPMPYEILPVETADYPKYAQYIKQVQDVVIIDLPGRIDDETLVPILKEADYIVCPFDYERSVYISTVTFVKFVKFFDKNKKIFFVPNRIRSNINYDMKETIDKELGAFGTVTKPITERVTLKRLNTFEINDEQQRVVEEVFNFIYTEIN